MTELEQQLWQFYVDSLGESPSFALVKSLDKRRKVFRNVGWLYALRNPVFKLPLLKLGMTKQTPYERSAKISSATAIPAPFELVYYVHVSNRWHAEAFVHSRLDKDRYRPNREFFNVTIAQAIRTLDQAAQHFPITMGNHQSFSVLPQDYGHVNIITCSSCGTRVRKKHLPIQVIARCPTCSTAV